MPFGIQKQKQIQTHTQVNVPFSPDSPQDEEDGPRPKLNPREEIRTDSIGDSEKKDKITIPIHKSAFLLSAAVLAAIVLFLLFSRIFLDIPVSRTGTEVPMLRLGETMEVAKGVKLCAASFQQNEASQTLTIRLDGINESPLSASFSSAQFELRVINPSTPNDFGYLTTEKSWNFTAPPDGKFSFTQSYYMDHDMESATAQEESKLYTLIMYHPNSGREKLAEFLLLE